MNPVGTLLPEERADRIIVFIAFCIVWVTGYFLFFYQGTVGVGEQAQSIGILYSDNAVRIRHAKSLRWGTSRQETKVYLRDTVYTPKDTTAEFQWQDKRFILEPDSLVQFDEASLDKLEINLMEGKIRTEPSAAKVLRISKKAEPPILFFNKQELPYLIDLNPLIIRHSELSARTSEVVNKKLEIEPMRAVMNPKLFLNRLSDYQMVLRKPQNTRYRFVGQSWLDFQWEALPLPNVEYFIQITNKSDFSSSAETKSADNHATILFEQSGSYWWKIAARWRRESLESDPKELVLDTEKGENIPKRSLTSNIASESRAQKVPPMKTTGKLPAAAQGKPVEVNGPKVQKTPFEILFGK